MSEHQPSLFSTPSPPEPSPVFSLPVGRLERDKGKAAAEARAALLEEGRAIAVAHARAGDGLCSADEVYRVLLARGRDVSLLGAAAGSLFDVGWEMSHWTPSIRVQNHGRHIRVWRLR